MTVVRKIRTVKNRITKFLFILGVSTVILFSISSVNYILSFSRDGISFLFGTAGVFKKSIKTKQIETVREKEKFVSFSGYLQKFSYSWQDLFVVQSFDNLKYLLTWSDFPFLTYEGKYVSIVWSIRGSLSSFPLVSPSLFSEILIPSPHILKDFLLTQSDFTTIIAWSENTIEVSNPIRPIPTDALSFTSYKGYTMYFPTKVYYEVFLIKESFWFAWLRCDNVVYVVGRDKNNQIIKNQSYIRDNPRVKVYVCSYDPIVWNFDSPPFIKWKEYITTEKKDKHFYVEYLHSARESFSSKIAVRNKKVFF